MDRPCISVIIIMGVSGSGKSSVASALQAQLLGRLRPAELRDGDTFHSPHNIAKMQSGTPLDDGDRQGWLAAINDFVGTWQRAATAQSVLILPCSALRRRYRDTLRGPLGSCDGHLFAYLRVPESLLVVRLHERDAQGNHFMGAGMLASQLATLEEPDPDETDVLVVDAVDPDGKARSVEDVSMIILQRLLVGLVKDNGGG